MDFIFHFLVIQMHSYKHASVAIYIYVYYNIVSVWHLTMEFMYCFVCHNYHYCPAVHAIRFKLERAADSGKKTVVLCL